MFDLFSGLTPLVTIIYTKAMPPHLAVVASGFFNFTGVLLGGVGVAYAIVHLLPVELLIDVDSRLQVPVCLQRPEYSSQKPLTAFAPVAVQLSKCGIEQKT